MASQNPTSTTQNQNAMNNQSQKEQAKEQAGKFAEGTKQTAQKMGEQTRDAWNQAREEPTPAGFQSALENLPSSFYLWATFGSIGLSLLLRLAGRKEFANFVGLWPPTIVAMALMNKQMRPSREMD